MKKIESTLNTIDSLLEPLDPYIDEFKTSLLIPIAFILSIPFFVFLSSPPTFPLPLKNEAIDCLNINVNKFYWELSRIKVNASAKDFVQYPKEIAKDLLNIRVKSGQISGFFPSNTFWDLESDGQNFSFCALTSIGGELTADLFCQNQYMASAKTNLDKISIYSVGSTKILPDSNNLFNFEHACIKKSKIMIFSNVIKNFPPISLSSIQNVSINIINSFIKTYSSQQNVQIENNNFLILPSKSKMPLFDMVLPAIAADKTSFHVIGKTDFIQQQFLNTKYKFENPSQKHRCFSKASFALTTTLNNPIAPYMTKNQIEENYFKYWLNDQRIVRLQSLYPRVPKESEFVIAIENDLKRYSKKFCPSNKNCTVASFDLSENVPDSAKKIMNADVLIVNTIHGLLYSGFLKPNSLLIEIELFKRNGMSIAKNMANNLKLKYHTIQTSEDLNIKCKNIGCFLEDESISKKISQLIQESIKTV